MRIRREEVIRLRVTADGKRRWQAAASTSGLSLSEWLRSAARAAARGSLDDRAVRQQVAHLRQEINRLGSNLNQVVAMAHAGHLDQRAVETALGEIAAMREAVQSALRP